MAYGQSTTGRLNLALNRVDAARNENGGNSQNSQRSSSMPPTNNNALAPSKSSPYYSNTKNPTKADTNRDMAMFIHNSTGPGENTEYWDALDKGLDQSN